MDTQEIKAALNMYKKEVIKVADEMLPFKTSLNCSGEELFSTVISACKRSESANKIYKILTAYNYYIIFKDRLRGREHES